jgi:hypothetical protein
MPFLHFLILQSGPELEWLKLVVNLGAFGLVSWLFYYVFKTMLPNLIKDFKEQLEAQRETFENTLNAMREDHKAELATQRQETREELQRQRQEFREEVQRERSAVEKVLALFKDR